MIAEYVRDRLQRVRLITAPRPIFCRQSLAGVQAFERERPLTANLRSRRPGAAVDQKAE
jgi:hypothetical protein